MKEAIGVGDMVKVTSPLSMFHQNIQILSEEYTAMQEYDGPWGKRFMLSVPSWPDTSKREPRWFFEDELSKVDS